MSVLVGTKRPQRAAGRKTLSTESTKPRKLNLSVSSTLYLYVNLLGSFGDNLRNKPRIGTTKSCCQNVNFFLDCINPADGGIKVFQKLVYISIYQSTWRHISKDFNIELSCYKS